MNIDDKINLKTNLHCHFNFGQVEQIEKMGIAYAPYYMDKLRKQGQYLAYRNSLPQWVKDMERH